MYFSPRRLALRALCAAVDWFFGMTYSLAGPGRAPDTGSYDCRGHDGTQNGKERAPQDLDLRVRRRGSGSGR
ncbi:hypothetical protein [Streptomyces avermitilis]|uniref:hypothetical protein n=1 Tax=Streptomyces avermitilis TaxID=33903 RepID=UPI0036BC6688